MSDNALPRPRRLNLSTVGATRQTLSRLVRLFDKGEIDEDTYRAHVYALRALLEYFRTEADIHTEERLSAIEQALDIKAGVTS